VSAADPNPIFEIKLALVGAFYAGAYSVGMIDFLLAGASASAVRYQIKGLLGAKDLKEPLP
jgi:hypothetical protein